MAKINTEKPIGKAQEKRMGKTLKEKKSEVPKTSAEKKEVKKTEAKKTGPKKVRKSVTSVNAENLRISQKAAASISKFIMKKKIRKAIEELEEVIKMKRAIPMKGEYAHRRGKIMSGKYPVKAAKAFISLLKSLEGNANQHDIEDPIITIASANKGTTTYASGGRTKKRTHVKIVASEIKTKETIK